MCVFCIGVYWHQEGHPVKRFCHNNGTLVYIYIYIIYIYILYIYIYIYLYIYIYIYIYRYIYVTNRTNIFQWQITRNLAKYQISKSLKTLRSVILALYIYKLNLHIIHSQGFEIYIYILARLMSIASKV